MRNGSSGGRFFVSSRVRLKPPFLLQRTDSPEESDLIDKGDLPVKDDKREIPLPICKAILICEKVIFDRDTGNGSAIGIFDHFVAAGFPFQSPPFWIFLQLDDGIGKYDLTSELRDSNDKVLVYSLAPVGVDFRMRPLPGRKHR